MNLIFLIVVFQETTISLLATGDINLGRQVGQEILKGDINFPFKYLGTFLGSADITFGNLESTISEQHGVTRRGDFGFTAPPAAAQALKNAGFDVVNTANNHVWDFGERACLETIDYLNKAGIGHTGTGRTLTDAYKPVIVERRGIKVGFLGVTNISNHGFEPPVGDHLARADLKRVTDVIKALRDSVDFIVISYHGDTEYEDRPTEFQRRFAHSCIDAGADIFFGNHPHVLQSVEWYQSGYIIYSFGNFVYFQHNYWGKRSVLLKLLLSKAGSKKAISAAYFPVMCGWQPSLADSTEYKNIMNHLKKISYSKNLEHL
jgi:poly-gamma-glutamate synthesis protein (capsule biosynthesis protein)